MRVTSPPHGATGDGAEDQAEGLLDAQIIGAGFNGMYQLYGLRALGYVGFRLN